MNTKTNQNRTLLMSLFLLLLVNSASADTIYVKSGSSGDGSSWTNAYGELQAGLDDAAYGDEIWVAQGTYKPTREVGRYKTFQMINGVAIYGGFPATGEPGWGDRDPNTYVTILSGDLAGNDEPVTDPEDLLDDPNRLENCYHVFYHPEGMNLDPNDILDGFTITGGNAYGSGYHGYGGGMCNYAESRPTVTNCILWDNTVEEIYNDGASSPIVTYSNIQGGYPGTGNIDADPQFKDPNGADNILGTADDNLQLAYNSPCIDAADNTAVSADTADVDGDGDTNERIPLDLAGHARFTDDPLTADTGVPDPPDYLAVVDMGAYERYEFCGGDLIQALKGDLNLDCYIDVLDFAIMAGYWLQYIGPE